MPIVWIVLCATSGDRCLLGGAKFPTAASSEHTLAHCRRDPADILKKALWLEAVRTEFFCYHFFHALKCNRFIKALDRAIKEFRIILLESQKRNLKIKCPCCSWIGALHVPLWFDITRNSRGGCSSREDSEVKEQRVRTCAWINFDDLICYIKWSRKKGSPMRIRSYSWF